MSRADSVSANDNTLQLHDGRTLGYAEYGIAEGKALFYFHGHPGARLEARFLAEQAVQAGIRLIGIDRPGVGHTGRFLSFLSMWLPWLLIAVARRFFRDEEHARKSLMLAARSWVEPDRKSLLLPEISELMAASLVEALRQGTRGSAYDGTLLGGGCPWGFKLEDIAFPTLYLWHGELDKDVPIAIGRAVAERLAQCKATYYPGEGHISL